MFTPQRMAWKGNRFWGCWWIRVGAVEGRVFGVAGDADDGRGRWGC